MVDKTSLKYLAISKAVVFMLKAVAQVYKMTLFDFVDQILSLGLEVARERFAQPFVEETICNPPLSFRYILSKEDKTYVKISSELHAKIETFTQERGVTMVNATRTLIILGINRRDSGDHRRNPEYQSWATAMRHLISQWEKNNPGHLFRPEGNPAELTQEEDKILRKIVFKKPHNWISSPNEYQLLLRALNEVQRVNKRLTKENEILKR